MDVVKEVRTIYKCGKCDTQYDRLDKAERCCKYICKICGKHNDTQEHADNCCRHLEVQISDVKLHSLDIYMLDDEHPTVIQVTEFTLDIKTHLHKYCFRNVKYNYLCEVFTTSDFSFSTEQDDIWFSQLCNDYEYLDDVICDEYFSKVNIDKLYRQNKDNLKDISNFKFERITHNLIKGM